MSRRTVALVASLILAAVATVALVSWARGLENRAFAGTKTVEVFKAKDAIPAGTTGDAAASRGLIERTVVPQKFLADGAIRSLEEIKGRVAAVTILKDEQIVAGRFVAPGTAGNTLPISADHQAISLQVNLPPGVAGFIQPGNHVSILAQLNVKKNGGSVPRVQFLLQDVEVLAIGTQVATLQQKTAQNQPAQQTGAILATLSVTPAQAEKLTYAIFNGQLYLTLLPQGQKPVTTPGRDLDNAFS